MGKSTGFMEYPREEMIKEPIYSRKQHFNEFEKPQSDYRIKTQAARCMDCGIPYCNFACPVENLIPEFNDFVYRKQWKDAYSTLQSTNNFPEFTGRICPAPCEPACVAGIVETPITIKQIELAIIEKAFENGWVKPAIISERTDSKIAVVGSGPSGLAAAQQLNLAGHNVTVFEKNKRIGGLLMYGIPDFKLQKKIIERRISILKQEGICFVTDTKIGSAAFPTDQLFKEFDYICLCCGAEAPRPLEIPGNELGGVHFAMDFLTQQNQRLNHPDFCADEEILATGKHVVVIGGGDTGSDCVGTSIRQKCSTLTQIQLHKRLPNERYEENPWPEWPQIFTSSPSQEEGGDRLFSFLTKQVLGENNHVQKLELQKIKWPKGRIKSGQRNYETVGEPQTIPCDLLLIALGFKHTYHQGLVADLGLEKDSCGNIQVKDFATSCERVFSSGDMVEGANLVVTAIMSGRRMAKAVDKKIKGFTNLL